MPNTTAATYARRDGESTSEYKIAKASGLWSIVATIIGLIVALGPEILPLMAATSGSAQTIGGAVAVASVIGKAFVEAGYINGRGAIKAKMLN